VQLGEQAKNLLGKQKILPSPSSERAARDVQKWKATSCTMDLHDRGNAALEGNSFQLKSDSPTFLNSFQLGKTQEKSNGHM
jgi:hypothetical protein